MASTFLNIITRRPVFCLHTNNWLVRPIIDTATRRDARAEKLGPHPARLMGRHCFFGAKSALAAPLLRPHPDLHSWHAKFPDVKAAKVTARPLPDRRTAPATVQSHAHRRPGRSSGDPTIGRLCRGVSRYGG